MIYGSYDVSKFLLDSGADPNIGNNLGETPLHQSTDTGQLEIVSLLLDHGADVNQIQTDGSSALHNASRKGFIEIAELLLNNGADPDLQEFLVFYIQFGKTALHIAAENKNSAMFELLLDAGADLNMEDMAGMKAVLHDEIDASDDSSEEMPAKAQEVYTLESYQDSDNLFQWLKNFKLDELFPVLVKNGFSDLEVISRKILNERDLIEMKIKKSGLRFRFMYKLDEEILRKSDVRIKSRKMLPDLREWLNENNLGHICKALVDSGYYFLEDLLELQYRKRLTEELSKLEISERDLFKLGVGLIKFEGESTERMIDSAFKRNEKGSIFDCGFCSAFKSFFN